MTLPFRFGTVGAPIKTPKKPGGSVGAIQFSKTLGLDAFELGWVQSVRVSEETCAAISQEAERQDVAISVHAPYFINLNADFEEWPKSRKRLMDAAHYGGLAGATDIIFHPGSYFEREPAEVLKVALPRLHDTASGSLRPAIRSRRRTRSGSRSGLTWPAWMALAEPVSRCSGVGRWSALLLWRRRRTRLHTGYRAPVRSRCNLALYCRWNRTSLRSR